MKRTKIADLLKSNHPVDNVVLKGWVRTRRDASEFSFIEVNDGSCLKNIQVIADKSLENYKEIKHLQPDRLFRFPENSPNPRVPGRNGRFRPIHSRLFTLRLIHILYRKSAIATSS